MYEKMIAAIVRETQKRMEEIDKSSSKITSYQMLFSEKRAKLERTAYKAMMFAREAHKAQRRKYTGNPYTDHLAEVAGIVASVATPEQADLMVSVAWLHDCIEDQGITLESLRDEFGEWVSSGVWFLSDTEKGNRAERKALSRARLGSAPYWVQTIKCADLISNTSSIVMHDPAFARVYLEEKRLLLDVLTGADPRLLTLARMQASAA
jgi:guanosine-3',5'-bis(diphosphate) 3'-pyrophosphohydrolase